MNVLVTGSAGFIGFHLCKALLGRGDRVIGIDNYSDYYDVSLKKARTKEILNHKNSGNFKEIICDIRDYDALAKVCGDGFAGQKIDCFVNLAAVAGVRRSLENPFVYEETNCKGFLNVLECCRRGSIKNLVYASSSSVYGGNTKFPSSESDCVDRPVSFYAATKKADELFAHTYSHLFGLNCTGLRFFTVYGPYGRPDMALFLFADAISKDRPIDVYNNGDMAKDFTYIDDIISGTLAAIDSPFRCEVFNLGRGETVKLTEFIECIEKELGKKAKKNMMPMQPGDVEKSLSDISKARKMLGYGPKVSVPEGIHRFVSWYKNYYSAGP